MPEAARAASAAPKAARLRAAQASAEKPRGSSRCGQPASSGRIRPSSSAATGGAAGTITASSGCSCPQPAGRLREDRGKTRDLAAARAGQQREQRLVGRDGELGAQRGGLGRRRLRLGGDRVADEVAGHPRRLHVGRLEREEREHMVDDLGHLRGAARPPGPDRRRDVVDDLQARPQPPGAAGDTEVEIRAVDGDERVRRGRRHRARGLADAPPEVRHPRQHLGEPHHRELLHREAAREPLPRHHRAADALERQAGAGEVAQAREERAAEEIAGRLARDDEETRAGHAGSHANGPSG